MRRNNTTLRLALVVGGMTLAGAALAAGMLTPAPATTTATATTGIPVPTCTHWQASSQAEQTAFIVGVANTFALEAAYRAKAKGTAVAPCEQSSKLIASTTIADVDARITAWCAANPTKATLPVIGVIWVDMVKPKLGM